MSRKRNQGSQTPQLNATPKERDESLQIELEEERERERDRNVASTTSSISNQEEVEKEEKEEDAVEVRDMPLILLATEKRRETKDAESNTDPKRQKANVESEISEDNKTQPLPNQRTSIAGQGVVFFHKETTDIYKTTSSDQYDKDEPVTTKTQKIYKKRPPIISSLANDSDESLEIQRNTHKSRLASYEMGDSIVDSDFPLSDATVRLTTRDSHSLTVTSSTSFFVRDSDSVDDGNLHPHFGLGSGLGFIYMAIPPDGGYGWVVLVLSFIAQLIVDGIVFTVGILLPYISKEFNVNSGQVVLVGSIQIGCYFMGGAFSSALINSYGFRPVALLGVVISALSLLAASFSPNLATMIVFYSVLGGPGLSMIWVSSQLIIGYYFERYRPIASGFSCSGAGAGICIFSITNTILVQNIGWRNTVRVQLVLVCLLFFVAMAYLEVTPTPVGLMHTDHGSSSSSNEYYGYFHVHNFLGDDVSSKRSRHVLNTYEPPKQRRSKWKRCVHFCCPCCGKKRAKHEPTPSERSERNYVVRPDPIQREDLFYTGPVVYEEPHNIEQFDGKELELVGTQTHLQRAAYGLHNIKDYDKTNEAPDVGSRASNPDPLTSNRPTTPTSQQSTNRRKKPKKGKKRHWLHNKIIRAFNRLFDVHLLKIFEFRILLASALLYPMGFNIPFVYSKMRTTIPTEYAQMIAPAIGASNFVIRNVCGFVAYKLKDWTNYICGGGIMFGGFMVFVSAFYGHDLIWFQFMYGLFYGIAPAVFATLRALIYVRYLGLSKLTNAFGITALAMGLGVFIGTTLGGVMVDQTGGYVVPFAFAGVCIMLSGALKLILPTLIKCRENRKKY